METPEVKIKVGIPVSYDYRLLEYSLPRVYPYTDAICLAIDKERKTWKGNSYQLPDTFFTWLRTFDTAGMSSLTRMNISVISKVLSGR